jgi:hypothetical protein
MDNYMDVERIFVDLRQELNQMYMGFTANLMQFEKSFRNRNPRKSDNEISKMIESAKAFALSTKLCIGASHCSFRISNPNKKVIYPNGDFLFKWSLIYCARALAKNVSFKIRVPEIHGNTCHPMCADPDMIEQATNNLIDNAMKYALPGTTVTLGCQLNENENMYQLEVTSYGLPLSDGKYEDIFERGYQGYNAPGVIEDSSNKENKGIGLAIVKEIADKHDGTVALTHEHISNFCIPYCYIYNNPSNEKIMDPLMKLSRVPDLRSNVLLELERLAREEPEYLEKITATVIDDFTENISAIEVMDKINKGVVKYIFVLSIPN